MTKSSTFRLSEAAARFVIPEGIVTTGWPAVAKRAAELDVGFDPWQVQLNTVALGKRADGVYAATVGGVVLSIPRQVGKTYNVGALAVLLCTLFPGLTVIWTAHHTRTSTKTFQSLQALVRRPKVRSYLRSTSRSDGTREANGEQEIRFRNGSVIMFGARERGFGRGFDAVDILVFDEAQILTERALDDMVATTNQSAFPAGALIFYMGTPPRPIDPGEAFTNKRKSAITGKSKNMVYLEASADPTGRLDDPKQWRKANFSYPDRTSHESMLRLRENLVSDDSWRREALGIWLEETGSTLFGEGSWDQCRAEYPEEREVVGIGLACAYDMRFTSLAVAVKSGDVLHGRPVHHTGGTTGIVDAAKQLQDETKLDVLVDPRSPVKPLIPLLEDAGVRLRLMSFDDAKDACQQFADRVKLGAFGHDSYPELDSSVAGTKRRDVGDRWVLDRKNSEDSSVLEAQLLAVFAADRAGATVKTAYESRGLMTV